jgi:hypothetical protein
MSPAAYADALAPRGELFGKCLCVQRRQDWLLLGTPALVAGINGASGSLLSFGAHEAGKHEAPDCVLLGERPCGERGKWRLLLAAPALISA